MGRFFQFPCLPLVPPGVPVTAAGAPPGAGTPPPSASGSSLSEMGVPPEPVSVSRTVLSMQDGSTCMNETNTSKENTTEKKRPRRHYDEEFKKAAVEHCARHDDAARLFEKSPNLAERAVRVVEGDEEMSIRAVLSSIATRSFQQAQLFVVVTIAMCDVRRRILLHVLVAPLIPAPTAKAREEFDVRPR